MNKKNMASYDKEYFYSFDDYERLNKNQPIPLSSWNDIKFDFYEIRFEIRNMKYESKIISKCDIQKYYDMPHKVIYGHYVLN